MILAGDIGGTNTRLAIFEGDALLVEEKFPSKNYQNLEEIVDRFSKNHPHKISKACFGIAGPVREEKCQTTNLPWMVDAKHMRSRLGISALSLLNDLEAKAYGLKVLKGQELLLIQKGNPGQKGNQGLIAAGTGLGEAGLYWDGKEHHPFACEGGHTDFAPRDALEIELLVYLQKKYSHVSYERIVSGPGIPLLYQFLIETGKEKALPQVQEAIHTKEAPLVIGKWAKEKDPGCMRAIDWFFSIYGSEAGNLALKVLGLGGIYIGGGIAPHFIDVLKNGSFLSSFSNKGRFKPLLESIPITIILNDDASLLGCAYFARKML